MHRAFHALRLLVLSATLVSVAPAFAVQPDEVLANPALEARARNLSKELRCMVCQNQSIDDSEAPLARDLRILVRERLTAGDSDAAVLRFLTARYGDFVLLKPPLRWDTIALWFAPVIVLLVGACGFIVFLRRRRNDVALASSALTKQEQQRLAELIEQSDSR